MEDMGVWRDRWKFEVVGEEEEEEDGGAYGGEGSEEFHPMVVRDGYNSNIARAWGASVGCGLEEELLIVLGNADGNDGTAGNRGGTSTAFLSSSHSSSEPPNTNTNKHKNIQITAETLLHLPQLIWNTFTIQSKLLTNYTLIDKSPPPTPLTPIDKAAIRGDVLFLQSFSTQELHDASTNTPHNVNTPLIWAAEHGQLEAVRYLLQTTILPPPSPSPTTTTPNSNNNNNNNSINHNNNNNNNSINHRGYLGCTAISRAARRNHIHVLQLLLTKDNAAGGGDPDIPNYKLQYPMHIAAFHGNRDAVEVLIDTTTGTGSGANVNVLDRKGRRPDEDTGEEGIKAVIVAAREAAS